MRFIGIDLKLEQIQRKINRIEDNKMDFRTDATWQNLRRQQDALYDMKRRQIEDAREL